MTIIYIYALLTGFTLELATLQVVPPIAGLIREIREIRGRNNTGSVLAVL